MHALQGQLKDAQRTVAQLEMEKVSLAERASADNQLLVQERAKNISLAEM